MVGWFPVNFGSYFNLTAITIMNTFFKPTEEELTHIKEITSNLSSDFTCFRITQTMFEKAIIDANYPIRNILRDNKILDFIL